MLHRVVPMIYANCRDRFTAEDFNFIVQTLAPLRGESVSLSQLLTDEECRDAILENPVLVNAILCEPAHLRISPQLYFYVLVRHVLKQTSDRAVCDYLAALLETFSSTAAMRSPVGGIEGPMQYLSDLLLTLRQAPPRQSFLIRAHVGNYSLFITGIFRETIERRSAHGAPDCSYYEEMGRSNYHAAATHRVARECKLEEIFDKLAEDFRKVRLGLNRLAENLFNFDPPPPFLHSLQ